MRPIAVAASMLLALFVVACGQSTGPLSDAQANGTASLASQPNTAAPTATHTTPGQVTLLLGKQRYGIQEPLLVTIRNGLQTDITLRDDGAGCTLLHVERLVQGTWQAVSQCAPLPAGRHAVVIRPGGALLQRIDSAHEMDSGADWPVGTYRAILTYELRETSAKSSHVDITVFSAEFTIA
jgi:hypothetical protein